MTRLQTLAVVIGCIIGAAWIGLSSYAVIQSFQYDAAQERYDQRVADERRLNTVNSCLERGRQNDGIVAYLQTLGAEPDDIQQARAFFPKLTRDSCTKSAVESISRP